MRAAEKPTGEAIVRMCRRVDRATLRTIAQKLSEISCDPDDTGKSSTRQPKVATVSRGTLTDESWFTGSGYCTACDSTRAVSYLDSILDRFDSQKIVFSSESSLISVSDLSESCSSTGSLERITPLDGEESSPCSVISGNLLRRASSQILRHSSVGDLPSNIPPKTTSITKSFSFK